MHNELIQKLAMSLDTCLDLVEREAAKEKRAGEGLRMKPITWQQRAASFRKLVSDARNALTDDGERVFF